MVGAEAFSQIALSPVMRYKGRMAHTISTWIQHPAYGHGQISGEHNENFWVVRFVTAGEKTILKTAIVLDGHPPSPEFKFNEKGLAAKAPKKTKAAALSFEHLLERFLAAYPDGVNGKLFDEDERRYKASASESFKSQLSEAELKRLIEGSLFDEVSKRALDLLKATNLVFHIEGMRFRDGLKTDEGKKLFANGLYDHLYGSAPEEERFQNYLLVLRQLNALSWPMATYFQFLASGGEAMFMKPTVSQRIAESVNVALNYKPEPNWLTYCQLLDVAKNVRRRLHEAGQEVHSAFDVQSFMWCAYDQSKK